MDEAGLPSATVPEALDGSGLDRRAGHMLVRRAAYHNLPVPLGEAMLARQLWAQAAGVHDQGITTLAAADRRDDVSLVPDARVGGSAARCIAFHGSPVADAVLLTAVAPDGHHHLIRAPNGSFTTVAAKTNLANEPRDTLVFADAGVPSSAVVPWRAGEDLSLHGAMMRVQQMVGAMQRALDSAVDYAMVRVQFGRTISKFQAVQQMLAEAAGHLVAAVASADGTLDAAEEDLPLAIALAASSALLDPTSLVVAG